MKLTKTQLKQIIREEIQKLKLNASVEKKPLTESVATTILTQLGGNKFRVMTGSKDFVSIDNGIQFKVGRNDKAVNFVKITLNGKDLYDMVFGRVASGKMKEKSRAEDVYASQIQKVFTSHTGMYTHF